MQTPVESRIYKFILRASTSSKALNLAAMERLGVRVRRVEYATDEEGRLLALVQLVDKMRRVDIMKRLLGAADGAYPYNRESGSEEARLSGVQMLVSSGDTKVEYQQLFAAHFVLASAAEGAGGESGKRKRKGALGENDEDGLAKMQRKPPGAESVVQSAVEPAVDSNIQSSEELRATELSALREENRQLCDELCAARVSSKSARARVVELEAANADLLAKKAAFDALTAEYASWRYDTRCKDERIAELQARTVELQQELARMTECRDLLARKK